jgi:hypothetical protein
MGVIADGTVDLVVTSPPYPMIEMWDEPLAAGDAEISAALEAGAGSGAFELMHRRLDPVSVVAADSLAQADQRPEQVYGLRDAAVRGVPYTRARVRLDPAQR